MAEPIPNLDNFLKGNPNDILLITNPDLECQDIDPVEGWAHKEYFQIKWDSRPHRIAPGQKRRMPRWLALHFAKHLADHLLMKEEETTGKHGLVQSPVRRPQVLATILLSVDELFEDEEIHREGEIIEKEVEEMNTPTNPLAKMFGGGTSTDLGEVNLGTIPNPTMGNLKPEPPTLEEIKAQSAQSIDAREDQIKNFPEERYKGTSIYDPQKPLPSKNQLLEDCYRLNIPITGRENVKELIGKLKAF